MTPTSILEHPRVTTIEETPTLDWKSMEATQHIGLYLDGKLLCYAFDWLELMNHHQALCRWLLEDSHDTN